METTGLFKKALDENDASSIGVDVIGLGAGVVDRLDEQGAEVEGINVSDAADDPERFKNLRSQIAWQVREALDPRSPKAISIPRDMEFIAQASAIKYKINSAGQIEVESKDDMRKRLGKSPDRFDAVALAIHKARQGTKEACSIHIMDDEAMAS